MYKQEAMTVQVLLLLLTVMSVLQGAFAENTVAESSIYDSEQLIGNSPNSEENQHTEFIGFSAWKQKIQEYNARDNITFEGVLLNEGSHYSLALSRFTCPLQGVYYISVTYRKNDNNFLQMRVYKEDDILLHSFGFDDSDSSPWNIISGSCLVSCSPGEHIYVQGNGDGSVYGDSTVPYTSFSVYLLYGQDSQRDKVEYHNSAAGYSLYSNTDELYSNGDVVTFHAVRYNDGNYALNRYVCPTMGIYYLSATLRQYHTTSLHVSVMQDNFTVLSYRDTDNKINTHTNSRLIRCEKNDTIVVQATGAGYVASYSYITAMLMNEEQDVRHDSFIGFTAYKTITQTYEARDTISFDAVLINEGSHYNRVFNRFVCPVDGIYLVSVNIMKNDTVDIEVDVKMESDILFRLTDTTGDNKYNTLSNTVFVKCFPDWSIQVVGVTAGDVFGDRTLNFSTFTVMLLHQK